MKYFWTLSGPPPTEFPGYTHGESEGKRCKTVYIVLMNGVKIFQKGNFRGQSVPEKY